MVPSVVESTWPETFPLLGIWKSYKDYHENQVFDGLQPAWQIDGEAVQIALDDLGIKGRVYILPQNRAGFLGEYCGMVKGKYRGTSIEYFKDRDRKRKLYGKRGPIHEVHVYSGLDADCASACIWHELQHGRQYQDHIGGWISFIWNYQSNRAYWERDAITVMPRAEDIPICVDL